MPVDKWSHIFNEAVQAATIAMYSGATPTPADRLNAAAKFRHLMDEFKKGGTSSLKLINSELHSQDGYRKNTAARILLQIAHMPSLISLSKQILQTNKPQLEIQLLQQLWQLMPPSIEEFKHFLDIGKWERVPMAGALLAQPTPQTEQLIALIESSKDYGVISTAINAISRWPNSESMLSKYLNHSLIDDSETFWIVDTKILAAFFLGLQGSDDAAQFLKNAANNKQGLQAVHACGYLVLLASPDAVLPLKSLLHSTNADVVARAIEPAATIGAATLLEDLALVAKRDEYSPAYDMQIGDEAVKAVKYIVGGELTDREPEYVWESIPERFTSKYKNWAAEQALVSARSFDLEKRYRLGQPITLAVFADELLSPHVHISNAAAYNLRAITGEDYGYKTDDDLLNNLESVIAWKKRAANPQPLVPGGWAYMGKSGLPLS